MPLDVLFFKMIKTQELKEVRAVWKKNNLWHLYDLSTAQLNTTSLIIVK